MSFFTSLSGHSCPLFTDFNTLIIRDTDRDREREKGKRGHGVEERNCVFVSKKGGEETSEGNSSY